MSAAAEAAYRIYVDFLDKAERNRRWNVSTDIPWNDFDPASFHPDRARTAETFCAIEMYLPDYVSRGIHLVRRTFGEAWFLANWAYEESKHSLALREYLVRSGQRTTAQMAAFEQTVLEREWELPFETPRQMAAYGLIQESTTRTSYKRELRLVERAGDRVLGTIYRYIARDEAAHAHFYLDLFKELLAEDRAGALADLAHVFRAFRMPGAGLVPDYERRLEVVRTAGIDRAVFLEEVWLPILRQLGVRRSELRRHIGRAPANDSPEGDGRSSA